MGLRFVDASPALIAERARIRQLEGRFAPMYIPWDYIHLDADGQIALAGAFFDGLSK